MTTQSKPENKPHWCGVCGEITHPNKPVHDDKTVLMLLGPSGSGKSYLENKLAEWSHIKKIVSLTTRERRKGETSGVDYHFVTQEHFDELEASNQILQTTKFADKSYGSTLSEYQTHHPFVTLVIVPESAAFLKHHLELIESPKYTVVVVYFDITQDRLRANMKTRGDSDEVIEQRMAQDDLKQQMRDSNLEPDYVITDDMLTEDVDEKLLYRMSLE